METKRAAEKVAKVPEVTEVAEAAEVSNAGSIWDGLPTWAGNDIGIYPPATATDTNATLKGRGSRYGHFNGHAAITQNLKDVMRATDNWGRLTSAQKESLEMVAHKIGRILNGDPNYADSWHDIAGYASLVDKLLNGESL